MGFVRSKLTVDPRVSKMLDLLPDKVLREIFPKVIRRATAPVKDFIVGELKDGQVTGTRAKQSKKTRMRFPPEIQAKKNVGSKRVTDTTGTLVIVGVSSNAKHVNFDHGEKAKYGTGRKHVLWGKFDESRKSPPLMRRQHVDISFRAKTEFAPKITVMFEKEVARAISSL
jgi:hypothetical protein